MKIKIAAAFLILSAALAACKKKPPETVPVPKADPPGQTETACSGAPRFSFLKLPA